MKQIGLVAMSLMFNSLISIQAEEPTDLEKRVAALEARVKAWDKNFPPRTQGFLIMGSGLYGYPLNSRGEVEGNELRPIAHTEQNYFVEILSTFEGAKNQTFYLARSTFEGNAAYFVIEKKSFIPLNNENPDQSPGCKPAK